MEYDASRDSLYRPGAADDFFEHGPYPTTAAVCAELSRLAYFGKAGNIDRTKLSGFLKRGNLELITVADIGGSQGILSKSVDKKNELVVIAFRGTESHDLRDLWTDLNFFRRRWTVGTQSAGRVHGGFARAIRLIFEHLKDHLPRRPGTLAITGHSLGAALASLAASTLEGCELYTFGEPRVGNAAYTRFLGGQVRRHHRYVDCCDLVTRVPPHFLGFKHAGDLHYIDRNGRVQVNPEPQAVSADRRRARRDYREVYPWFGPTVALRGMADHAPINYVSAVLGKRSGLPAKSGV